MTVTAVLGPTNTGKTHRAIARMLQHRTGMFGLPLRLLAREVYDRVAARVGAEAVALVTGEEKRIPARPRYWICTVEAMPMGRGVDFVAVDEVQLAAHPERGHVFTDRILRARGERETMLLGSDAVADLLGRLVPTAAFEHGPRLSRLSWSGHRRLRAMPPRSAVVSFSVADVYALAERLRARHGGTAVVLGALSPRTRNAQVAMYQAGEVPVMVATDAIGMGLNLDLDHVAFASLRKFDGEEVRGLDPLEIGQIAGRAGRFRRDGTFGTTGDVGPLDPEVVDAVERQSFPPLRRLAWRNPEPDASSVRALRESLALPPPRPFLRLARNLEDERALESLLARADVQSLAGSPERVALLWEVCQVPDFRKSLFDDHVALLAEVYGCLAGPGGRIPEDRVARHVERLDRPDGDIESLMARMAATRTWTYLSWRRDWLDRAAFWQERTRAIEDRLSDALHERLTERFVDRRAVALVTGGPTALPEARLRTGGIVEAAGHPLGRLEGLRFVPDPAIQASGARSAWRAARRAVEPVVAERVTRLVAAPHDDFSVDAEARLLWEGARVGLLVAGSGPLDPRVRLLGNDLLPPDAAAAVRDRLQAWIRAEVEALLAPLRGREADRLGDAGRGVLFQVVEGLGGAPRAAVVAADGLRRRDRERLAALGVQVGVARVWADPLVRPAALTTRALLWAVSTGISPVPAPPDPDLPSLPRDPSLPDGFWEAVGYPVCGPRAVRADVAEAAARRLAAAARGEGTAAPSDLAPLLACDPAEVPAVAAGLGWRLGDPRPRPIGRSRPAPERP